MNRFKLSLLLLAVLSSFAVSCVKDELPPKDEYLEVNANNISGKWKLEEWNGSPLSDGTFVYIDIERKDRKYTIYQNLDSFADVPHIVSGTYNIDTDPELGAVIRGSYDHDSGEWAHRYIITELTSGSMVWTAKDDPGFVQRYVKIESIPVAKED